MANTMVKIASVTVTASSASSIDFNNIPQGFTDLKLLVSARWDQSGSTTFRLKFNSSTTDYSRRWIQGNGSAVSVSSDTSGPLPVANETLPGTNYTSSVFGNVEIYIPNYTSSNYKSVSSEGVSENNATTAYQTLTAGLWSNTAAITSIVLDLPSGGFAQYSSATLYGILKA